MACKPRVCGNCGQQYFPRRWDGRSAFCYDPACQEVRNERAHQKDMARKRKWYKNLKADPIEVVEKPSIRPLKRCKNPKCRKLHDGYFELCHDCIDRRRSSINSDFLYLVT